MTRSSGECFRHPADTTTEIDDVALQEGTRHATLTALGQVLPERVLQDFSRHRDRRSLDHYARPKASPAVIRRAMSGENPSHVRPTPDLGRKNINESKKLWRGGRDSKAQLPAVSTRKQRDQDP